MTADEIIAQMRGILLGGPTEASHIQRELGDLLASDAFHDVVSGYVVAGGSEDAVSQLFVVVMWLSLVGQILKLEPVANGDLGPHAIARHIAEKQQLREQHARTLRSIALDLVPRHADALTALAAEIEGDSFAIKGYGVPDDLVRFLLTANNLGAAGAAAESAANPEGAWRGWIIRSLGDQLPYLHRTPNKWATVRDLLAWAGLDGVTSYDVASTLKRRRS